MSNFPSPLSLLLVSALLASACATNKAEGLGFASRAQELCAQKMDGPCVTRYRACMDDPGCSETFACSQRCASNDKQCVWDCILARPNTAATFFEASYCGVTQNEARCSLPDGIINECPVCSSAHCPAEMNTCFGNKECWDLVACVRDTCAQGDLECAQVCIGKHPGGLAEIQGLRECSSQHCVEACATRETYENG